ncbi:MAG: hypothetical protein ACO1SV_04460 [Fimbriimonas sp.]
MLPFPLLLSPTLDPMVGYYTLAELGAALKVEVRPDCAEEVYALRLQAATTEQVLAALKATGRLDVGKEERGWTIRRSPQDRDDDRAALQRYLNPVLGRYARVRTAAARQVVQLLNEPPDVAEREIDRMRRQEGESRDVAALVYLTLSAKELPFASLALAAPLAGSDPSRIGKAVTFSAAQNPDWFLPPKANGRIAIAPTTRPDLLLGATAKIMLDPVAVRGSDRILFDFGGELAGQVIASEHRALLTYWPLPPRPEEVLSRQERPSYRDRIAQTAEALAPDGAGEACVMPAGAVHVSDALLNAAQAVGQNLVAYVSPLSNRMLPGVGKRSLRNIVATVNEGGFDPEFDRLATRERCGMEFGASPKVAYWPGLSAHRSGPILTIRTETDFLDRLVDGPPTPPKSMMNLRAFGKAVTMASLVEHVAALKPNAWTGSTFSSQYLGFTNPTSFYPLARAFAKSPALLERFRGMASGEALDLPLDRWDAATKRELEAGILKAADKCDAIADQVDPLHTARMVRDGRFSRMVLRVTRDGDRYGFRLFLQLPQREGKTFWTAWTKGVS